MDGGWGLDTLQYVTLPRIENLLGLADVRNGKKLVVTDLEKMKFQVSLTKRKMPFFPYPLFRLLQYLKNVFRLELSTNLFVYVELDS